MQFTWKFNYSEVEFFKIRAVSLKLVLIMVQIAWKYSEWLQLAWNNWNWLEIEVNLAKEKVREAWQIEINYHMVPKNRCYYIQTCVKRLK